MKCFAAILDAANRWKKECLLGGTSLLGEEKLWTHDTFGHLQRHYTENLYEGSQYSFEERLQVQLEPAPPEAKKLCAEVFWVYYLLVRSVTRAKKLDRIKTVWEWSGASVPENHWALGDVLDKGVVLAGMAYNLGLWKELMFIFTLMHDWTTRSASDRKSLLSDPWRFAEFLDEQPDSDRRQFRHALLFLLFPNDFQPMVSSRHKRKIVRAFQDQIDETVKPNRMSAAGIDRTLLAIQSRLQDQYPDQEVYFYSSPFKEIWQNGPPEEEDDYSDGDEEDEWNEMENETYTIETALADLFLEETQFRRVLKTIKLHKNLILQGPPGVGKTFIAKRIAWCLMGREELEAVEMVQFHQSYAYEDFVQGYRPTEEGGFTLREGPFLEFCERAAAAPDQPFVFIIDEINRGNLSRIFGELLMLIEPDKRGPEHEIKLTYGRRRFSVPNNVHLLGLMNTADRSLAIMDYALRRRFRFETLKPEFGTRFREHLLEHGIATSLIDRIIGKVGALNERIREEKDLGSDFEIGHSYFVPNGQAGEQWYLDVIDLQIKPLLREYWFDHADKVEEMVEDLRR